jgi:hypothetical protein
MRIRHWLIGLGVLVPVTLVTAGGCGGSEDEPTDAGSTEAAVDAVAKDVAPDNAVVDSGPSCIDADLATLTPDDAALNDAGASVGTCVTCTRANCNTFLTQCNADCDCKEAVVAFYGCVAKGGGLQSCGLKHLGGLGGNAAAIGQNLGLCVASSCRQQCGVPDGGIPDGAIPDSGGGG